MNSELARQAIRAVLPQMPSGPARPVRQPPDGSRLTRSQTTVFVFHMAEGLLLGGDRRTTGFYTEIASEDTVKIEQITSSSALLASGYVSSSQWIEDELKHAINVFQANSGIEPSLEGQARFASRLCAAAVWEKWLWGFEALLAGRDADDEYKIVLLEEDGGRIPYTKFYATGCGWTIAKTILWRGWKSGMTRQESVHLGAQALVYAGLMDNGTSDFRAGVVPSLATVTDAGFAWVPVEEVDAAAREVMADVRARGVVR
jgi:20S proteasome alpha/beta subunit